MYIFEYMYRNEIKEWFDSFFLSSSCAYSSTEKLKYMSTLSTLYHTHTLQTLLTHRNEINNQTDPSSPQYHTHTLHTLLTHCTLCALYSKTHTTHKPVRINKSLVNPESTSNQPSKPCIALQYPSRKACCTPQYKAIRPHTWAADSFLAAVDY